MALLFKNNRLAGVAEVEFGNIVGQPYDNKGWAVYVILTVITIPYIGM